MRTKKLSIMVLSIVMTVGTAQAGDKNVKFVSNSIHCGGCANKIKTAVTAVDGVSGVDINLESKVVSINYDDAKVNPEKIQEAIAAAKHTAEPYDPAAVIEREIAYYAKQINCGGCAGKVKKNLSAAAGILSVEADPATKIVNVKYDANKTSSKEFKGYFEKFDYTVTRYWDSDRVKYTRFNLETIGDKAADIEKSLNETEGIYDFTVNAKTNTVAIAYDSKSLTEESVADAVVKNNNLTLAAK